MDWIFMNTRKPHDPYSTLHPRDLRHGASQQHGASKRVRRRRTITALALVFLLALGGTATALFVVYQDVNSGINRSGFTLPGTDNQTPKPRDETNILIMGLDSRVDQNGNPLDDEVYQYLRAGDEGDGGYNANVLMFIHIPAGDGEAVGISIPRDDYVELPGAPSGTNRSKIKEAYGLAFSERYSELNNLGELSRAEAYQEARAAGRQAQITTVSAFLGDVRIDHFIEMTMGGFFSIASAIAPLTVCLNNDTEDIYSGAYFHAGIQELDASEAMSFVRQRRDTGDSDLVLTDFDRTRRQQAFLVSLANKLKQQQTFTDPGTLNTLISAAKQHMALDDNFELLSFAQVAADLANGKINFVTLPITEFADVDGRSVNLVNLDEIHQIVAALMNPARPTNANLETDENGEGGEGGETGANFEGTVPEEATTESANPGTKTADKSDTTVYRTWDEPLRSGSLPCVN